MPLNAEQRAYFAAIPVTSDDTLANDSDLVAPNIVAARPQGNGTSWREQCPLYYGYFFWDGEARKVADLISKHNADRPNEIPSYESFRWWRSCCAMAMLSPTNPEAHELENN
jgi:hypothetical protein